MRVKVLSDRHGERGVDWANDNFLLKYPKFFRLFGMIAGLFGMIVGGYGIIEMALR